MGGLALRDIVVGLVGLFDIEPESGISAFRTVTAEDQLECLADRWVILVNAEICQAGSNGMNTWFRVVEWEKVLCGYRALGWSIF